MGINIRLVKSENGRLNWDYEHPRWSSVRVAKDRTVGYLLSALDNERHPECRECFRPQDFNAISLIADLAADSDNPEHRHGHPRYNLLDELLKTDPDLWIAIL